MLMIIPGWAHMILEICGAIFIGCVCVSAAMLYYWHGGEKSRFGLND